MQWVNCLICQVMSSATLFFVTFCFSCHKERDNHGWHSHIYQRCKKRLPLCNYVGTVWEWSSPSRYKWRQNVRNWRQKVINWHQMSDRFCGFYSVGAHTEFFFFLTVLIIFTLACAIRWGGDGVKRGAAI